MKSKIGFSPSERSLWAEVILGCPSKQCVGAGVCMIMEVGHLSVSSCPRIPINIRWNRDGRWVLFIEKKNISSDLEYKHFGNRRFRIEEPYKMPEFICQGLSVEHSEVNAWLLEGEYPILDLGYGFLINI